MKTNFTYQKLILALLFIAVFLLSIISMGQAKYDFKDPALVSGTDKAAGAVYLFSNVKAGVDARVVFLSITPGVIVRDLDGGSGFREALQPDLRVSPGVNGYLEIRIDFLYAGTNTLFAQTEVPITCFDVDGYGGSRYLKEFDDVEMSGGYVDYQVNGGELDMTRSGNWITGKNNGGIEYPERDTTAKQVMFTVVKGNVSSIHMRIGIDNQSTRTETRQRSVYFNKFVYPNSVLAKRSLISFRGLEKNNTVDLQWMLEKQNQLKTVVIERQNSSKQFTSVGEVKISENNSTGNYAFHDNLPADATTSYRLKLVSTDNSVEYSNILVFHSATEARKAFGIYPSIVYNTANMHVKTKNAGDAKLQVVDYSGRIVLQKNIATQAGTNNISLSDLGELNSGTYVVVLKLNDEVYNERIVKK